MINYLEFLSINLFFKWKISYCFGKLETYLVFGCLVYLEKRWTYYEQANI